ncbi:hypothetical protein ACHEUQ_03125 [Alloscardovia omnicolens]|uniref:hypothetical protein n=1 Tax=Alloscardovia omnicolens TaxID=419015 RepID=UPI00375789D3
MPEETIEELEARLQAAKEKEESAQQEEKKLPTWDEMPTVIAQPHDHLPPKGQVKLRGEIINVNPHAMDDFELIENMAKIMSGDISAMIKAMHTIFDTEEAFTALKKLATVNGYTSTKLMGELFNEALTQMNPNS